LDNTTATEGFRLKLDRIIAPQTHYLDFEEPILLREGEGKKEGSERRGIEGEGRERWEGWEHAPLGFQKSAPLPIWGK